MPIDQKATLAPLRPLHESIVLPEEIAFGHMNVRFYGARALAATDQLLAELQVGMSEFGATRSLVYELPRLFTRYHREQHTGAKLSVLGGLLEARQDGLRVYHELRNPDRDELAASFVQDLRFRAPGESGSLHIPSAVRKDLESQRVSLPIEGGPRTLELDASPIAPLLQEALDGDLAIRLPRRIDPADCDAEGRLPADVRPFYMWGGDPIPPRRSSDGPDLSPLPDGAKMGWTSLENRSVMVEEPMAGMRIQSFGAAVELSRKTVLKRFWIFDLESGRLLLANDVVELALHRGDHRAIEIPSPIRRKIESELRPDLR